MFPIRDHNPSGRKPVVVYALIALNFVAFALTWLAQSEGQIGEIFMQWGLVPAAVTAGYQLPSFLTSMFLHAGWMHILGNMLFLWIFGDNLEDLMGPLRFLIFYLACGFAADFLQIAADPASMAPMVGASGAIAGVMGGYMLMFPKARVDVLIFIIVFVRIFPLPAWVMLGFWFLLQLGSGTLMTEGDGVAYWAHIGGFAAGLVFTLPLWLARGGRAFWAQNLGLPPHPGNHYEVRKTRFPTVRRIR